MFLPALLGSPRKALRKEQSAKHKEWHVHTKSIPGYGSPALLLYPQSPPAVIQVFVKGTFPKRIKVQFLHLFLTALFLCPEGSPGCSPDAGRLPDEEGWLLTGKLQPRTFLTLCQTQTLSLSTSQPQRLMRVKEVHLLAQFCPVLPYSSSMVLASQPGRLGNSTGRCSTLFLFCPSFSVVTCSKGRGSAC